MGYEDRDYFRGSSGYSDYVGSWGLNLSVVPPVCRWLVAINIIVFVAQILVTRPMTPEELAGPGGQVPWENDRFTEEYGPGLEFIPRVSVVQQWADLDTQKTVFQGQVWRLVTSAFCHAPGDIFHILFNMLFLWWFGKTLERMYGSREFLLFYLTSAAMASLTFVGLQLFTGDRTPAIGASGAVMGVVMLYALYYPRDIIYVMYIIPLEIRWLVLLYVLYDVHPVLLMLAGHPMYTGVAHAAHLGGLAFGFAYGRFHWRLGPWFDRVRWRRTLDRWPVAERQSAPSMPTPPAPSPAVQFEQQIDHILQKIHEQGQETLTESEKRLLQLASQRYRKP